VRWETFPVSASPRPVVLLDPRVDVQGGFVDGASKSAWIRGAIDFEVEPPPGVLERVVQAVRGAEATTRLRVTAIESTTEEFLCDRGPRPLPAYRLAVTGLRGCCVVLDPLVACWWPRGDEARSLHLREATIEADDRTVHFPAFGGVLTEFHHAELEEHEAYVVGKAITSRRRAPGGAIPAVGITKKVVGVLTRPLGARVLIDLREQPLAVTPELPAAPHGPATP
jgi:hypothetical protein